MTTYDPVPLLHRLVVEGYNQGNLTVAKEVYAASVCVNDQPVSVADLQAAIRQLHRLFPGFQVTLEALQTTGEWVVATWTTHRGADLGRGAAVGIPRPRSRTGLRLFRIRDGQIIAVWYDWAAHDQLTQLAVPGVAGLCAAWP